MKSFLQEFLGIQPISGITINTIFTSTYFTFFLYVIFLISAILITIFTVKKRGALTGSFKKSIILSLLIVSLLYLLHSESVWYNWFINDWKALHGLDKDTKLFRLEGPLYDFALRLKKLIPEDFCYTIYSTDIYFPYRLEYFMLPLKKGAECEYIVVIADEKSLFDPFTGVFSREDKIITNLEPYFFYSEDAYVIRKK